MFLSSVRRELAYVFSDQEMLKYSKTCEGADDLQEALTSILGILKAVNDSMHLIAITGYEVSSLHRLARIQLEVRDELVIGFSSTTLL